RGDIAAENAGERAPQAARLRRRLRGRAGLASRVPAPELCEWSACTDVPQKGKLEVRAMHLRVAGRAERQQVVHISTPSRVVPDRVYVMGVKSLGPGTDRTAGARACGATWRLR